MSATEVERESALRAELVAAARTLHQADEKASPDAWRCPHCYRADTLRIRDAEQGVIHAARNLAQYLASPQ